MLGGRAHSVRSCDRGCLACGAGPTNAYAELRQRAANFAAVARVGRVAEDARVRRRQAVFRVGAAVAASARARRGAVGTGDDADLRKRTADLARTARVGVVLARGRRGLEALVRLRAAVCGGRAALAELGGDQRHGTGTFRRGVCDDDAIGLVIVLQRVDLRRRRVHRPVQVTLDRAIGGGQNGSGEVEQRCAIAECANGEIDAGGGFDLDMVAGDGDSDRGLVCRGLGDCGAHDGRPDLEAGRRICPTFKAGRVCERDAESC